MDEKAYAAALKRELAACEHRVEELEAFAEGVVAPAVLDEAKASVKAVKSQIEKLAPAKSRAKKAPAKKAKE